MSTSNDLQTTGQNWTPYVYIAIACVIFIIVLIGTVKYRKRKKSRVAKTDDKGDGGTFSMKAVFDELAALQARILEKFKQKRD